MPVVKYFSPTIGKGQPFNMLPNPAIVAQDFDAIAAVTKSFRQPLQESVQKVAIPSIKKNFLVGGRPKWTPLTEFTNEKRKERGYPPKKPILIESGQLMREATSLKVWKFQGNAVPTGAGHHGFLGGGEMGAVSVDWDKFSQSRRKSTIATKNTQGRGRGKGRTGATSTGSLALIQNFGSIAGVPFARAKRMPKGPERTAALKRAINRQAAQMGTAHGEIPARPFMFLQEEDEAGIHRVFMQWYFQRITRLMNKNKISPAAAAALRDEVRTAGKLFI